MTRWEVCEHLAWFMHPEGPYELVYETAWSLHGDPEIVRKGEKGWRI